MNIIKKILSYIVIAATLASPVCVPQEAFAGFVDIFGGSTVSPAEVSYAAYNFAANLTLYWPQFANGQPNVAARFMNMTASSTGLNVSMPDATLNSVGYDTIIFNAGSNSFNVVNYSGAAIVTIAPGQTYYLMLNNNTTQSGTWQTVQFGVGTSAANASALAGAGLLASAGLLNVNLNGVLVSSSYTLTAAARDILQVWTGGSGTITLPASSSVGNGFLFPLANNGSGSVTVAAVGGDLIDGASTSVFAQTQSGFVLSTGTGWVTLGKGIQNTFAVTLLNLNIAGGSNVTETSAQAQNIIQQFTGTITANINVIVPNTVQLYYIYNDTSGAYTVTLTTAGGTGITIAQGSHAILYCDGTNIVNAFTATITSNLTIPVGAAASPSLNVTGSLTTGLFSAIANTISVAANGNEVMRWLSNASAVNYFTATSAATGQTPLFSVGSSTDSNVSIAIQGKGTGTVGFNNIDVTGGTVDNAVIGGVTPASITGTTITANANFSGPLTGTVTGHSTLDLAISNNLSDVASAVTSLSNLGGAPLASPTFTGTLTALNGLFTGTLQANGAATLNSTLGVAGNSTLSGTLGVTGSSSFSTITASGSATAASFIPTSNSAPSGAGIYLPNSNTVGIAGHLANVAGGTSAPTCSTGCASITAGSTDVRGSFVVGTTQNSGTINFGSTWGSAPFCVANSTSGTGFVYQGGKSASSYTFNFSTALSGVTVTYICMQ